MSSPPKSSRGFTEAARLAAAEARRTKRESANPFGTPELFIVRKGGHSFTWELRRFGGLALQHGTEVFPDAASARVDGEKVLKALLATVDQPAFR